jgi:hypothetical protein
MKPSAQIPQYHAEMPTELMRSHNRKFKLDDLTEIRKEALLKRLRNLSEPNNRPVAVLKSTEGLRLNEASI